MKLEQLVEQAHPYYSLVLFDKENGYWHVEFGDYDRRTVKDEAAEYFGQRKKIIKTADDQKAINAAVDQLNAA